MPASVAACWPKLRLSHTGRTQVVRRGELADHRRGVIGPAVVDQEHLAHPRAVPSGGGERAVSGASSATSGFEGRRRPGRRARRSRARGLVARLRRSPLRATTKTEEPNGRSRRGSSRRSRLQAAMRTFSASGPVSGSRGRTIGGRGVRATVPQARPEPVSNCATTSNKSTASHLPTTSTPPNRFSTSTPDQAPFTAPSSWSSGAARSHASRAMMSPGTRAGLDADHDGVDCEA